LWRRNELAPIAKQFKRDLFAHLGEGGVLPTVRHPETGELLRFKAARKCGRNRVWRSEAIVRAILLGEGFELGAIQERPRLKSPAQMEKFIVRELIQELWCFPERGVVIVPENSPLEEVSFT
jgi:hypothetical protein